LERLIKKEISRRQAAKELNIGYATLKRLLDAHARELQDPKARSWSGNGKLSPVLAQKTG
jgi:hypothetical protein